MDFTLLLPEIVALSGALLVLLLDLHLAPERKSVLGWVACGVALAALAATFLPEITAAAGKPVGVNSPHLYLHDSLGLFMKRCFAVTAFLVFFMSHEYVASLPNARGEFWTLGLFGLTGMMLCAGVNDFMSLFVALETVTLSFFVLSAFRRDRASSVEAGLKLLVIGSLAAGFLLYGIAFIYGATGSVFFDEIQAKLAAGGTSGIPAELLVGVALIFIGLGFKISAVPLHVWVPDVYQGAPTPITAYLSVGSKLAGLVLVLRVLNLFNDQPEIARHCTGILAVLGALSLLFGNLGALPQTNIKRLMGYSSIAQCGYLLVGLAAGWTAGIDGALFYSAAYVAMNLCAFLVILVVSRATGSHEIDDYAGLSRRSPILGMGLTVSLLSLAGVPPFWGFVGKFMLVGASFADPTLRWLGIIALVMVVVALFYYLRIVKRIWVFEERVKTPIATPLRMQVFIVVATIVLLGLAIYPAWLESSTGAIATDLGFPTFSQIRR